MRIIGDVHGKIEEYIRVLPSAGDSLQVGDMGLGFGCVPELDSRHKFLRGNHDSPNAARAHKNYLGDFGYDKTMRMFCLSGAFSIDYAWRQRYNMTADEDHKVWWADEELNLLQLDHAVELYKQVRPALVVTHDCPTSAATHLLDELVVGFRPEKKVRTRTGGALDRMFAFHQPRYWIFGHYHIDSRFDLNGTTFMCLNELSHIDIEACQLCEKGYTFGNCGHGSGR